MRVLTVCLTLMLALALPQRGQALDDQVTDFTLDNGLRVVVIEDHRAPVVVHMLWYRAGAADEPPGASGIAHFLEHLMFKGTDTLDAGEFSAIVARNGGSDNAFTSYDYTAYFQRVATDRLDLVMQMEADRMVNLQLTPEAVATERDVIIEERNQRVENNPSALFREQMGAAQYLNHGYGIPIIGWKHEVQALNLADARDFYRANYAPGNAVLVIAGDVTPDRARRLAQTHYGPITANAERSARARPQEPPQRAERRLRFTDPRVSQPYVTRSYLAPSRQSGHQQQAAALTVLAELLGGGTSSVLAEKLQFDQRLAVQTGAWYSGSALDDTTFNLAVIPAPGVSLQRAEDALDDALTGFIETGIDAGHLARIKRQMRAAQIYARDDVSQLARRYGSALTQGLTVADVQTWPDALDAVTGADVLDAARSTLNPDHAVTGWLMAPEVTQ